MPRPTTWSRALKAHLAAGRTRLILDLRGNPGGYVTAARKIASQFIASGPVFWEQDAQGDQVATDALGDGVATDADLQRRRPHRRRQRLGQRDRRRARSRTRGGRTLVGQQSFGKGTVQQWQELSGEGGAFKLTIARWLTPDKRWIHGVGLTPDVVVDAARRRSRPAAIRPSTRRSRCWPAAVGACGGAASRPPDGGAGAPARALALAPRIEYGFRERKEVMCSDRQY